MDLEVLKDLARYQQWADNEHWKALHASPTLLEDAEIRKRLNHMIMTSEMLATLARGEMPDMAAMKDRESPEQIEAAMQAATEALQLTIASVDVEKMMKLPRGPNGPFDAPAGMLLFQVLMHGQHHRGQNASRMHELGVKPPMTDYIYWYALGRP